MKRTYIKPALEVVDIETMATCIQPQSWNVDGGKNPNDHDNINEDKGEKYYKDNKEYDPWNSDNW